MSETTALVLVLALTAFTVFFLPTVIAACRSHRQLGPILVLNMLLGWTGVVWIACLAWSFSYQRPRYDD